MLHAVKHVTGAVLWSNLHLLFWLSLMPFTTAWMGENHFAPLPVSIYGVVLLMSAIAYYILVRALIARHGRDSEFAARIGSDWKGKIPLVALHRRHRPGVRQRLDLAGAVCGHRRDVVHSGSPVRSNLDGDLADHETNPLARRSCAWHSPRRHRPRDAGEVPVGAVVVLDGRVIGTGFTIPSPLRIQRRTPRSWRYGLPLEHSATTG